MFTGQATWWWWWWCNMAWQCGQLSERDSELLLSAVWQCKSVCRQGRWSLCVCVDVDECSKDSAPCGPLGTCQNTAGGFQCSCPRGYEPDSSRKSCQDLDECGDEEMCQYGCINLPGGYRCECPIGFIQHIYWNQCIGEFTTFTLTRVQHSCHVLRCHYRTLSLRPRIYNFGLKKFWP